MPVISSLLLSSAGRQQTSRTAGPMSFCPFVVMFKAPLLQIYMITDRESVCLELKSRSIGPISIARLALAAANRYSNMCCCVGDVSCNADGVG